MLNAVGDKGMCMGGIGAVGNLNVGGGDDGVGGWVVGGFGEICANRALGDV